MIRKRSKKMEAKYVLRRKLVAKLLEERPWCERCLGKTIVKEQAKLSLSMRSVVIHEKLTRARGGDSLDEANCVALCNQCHRWVHDNPRLATEAGLLVPRFGKAG